MRCACIDIGSNTTRLLVAECPGGGRLREIHQERAFTQIGRTLTAAGELPPETVAEVARIVVAQAALARELGARELRIVGTAAIRTAVNRARLVDAVRAAGGLTLQVLDEAEEARLAFVGAARIAGPVDGELAVIDVGGGSTEIAIGTPPASVRWSVSLPLGSGGLTRRFLSGDPPDAAALAAARDHVEAALAGLQIPRPAHALAVGGSANSLSWFAGAELGPDALAAALSKLLAGPAAEVAAATGLDPQRVELLPGGLVILRAVSERLGRPLAIGRGGIREGVVLELAAGSSSG